MDFLTSAEEFIRIVAEMLGISPIWAAALVGGVVFSAVAGIIGRIVFRLGMWSKQAGAADRPQTATTSKTPRQVVQESSTARVKLLGCQLVILIVLVVVVLGWLGILDDVLLHIQQIIGPTG